MRRVWHATRGLCLLRASRRHRLVGGRRAATLYTLIETARFNGINPEAWLSDVTARIADYPISRIDEMLPWAWAGNVSQIADA